MRSGQRASLLPGLGFLVAGCVVMAYERPHFQAGLASRDWPAVEGEIVSSTLRDVGYRLGPGDGAPSEGLESSLSVRYAYAVDGFEYSSSRLSLGESLANWQGGAVETRVLAGEYFEGKKVRVYYDPNDPQRAVLDPGVPPLTWLIELGGLILALLGFGLASDGLMRRRQA